MRVVYAASHQLHNPRVDLEAGVAVEHREKPTRADAILNALRSDNGFSIAEPTDHGLSPIQAVHAPGLIRFLETAWQAWSSNAEMIPDSILHPALRSGMDPLTTEPSDMTGRLGYWCFDTGTPIMSGTYLAARGAVDVALTAADMVLGGERIVYGLCRPPGHHAAEAVYGGFCYFNNAAIAADYLVRQTGSNVAVVDVDYHHGNGTQQIFYERADVLYVSLHADPGRAYPYFSGHADETGSGRGLGFTVNIPLSPRTTDTQYLSALDGALEAVSRFQASITIVSLGIDTYHLDPLGDFSLTTSVYAECGRRLAAAASPLVVLQEGGYYVPDLGENVRQFLRGATPVR
jgi:acetoin utilization deacetylase AcuC-like enzyme